MKNIILILLTLLLFTACSSKKYYTLGNNLNITSDMTYTKEIDIVKVNVPKYLKDHILVRQVSPYQVELIDQAQWLTPMQKRLTNILIDYLHKSMNNPNVHLYPWDGNKNPYKRVSVNIKRFIAYENMVYLQANYKIHNFETKTTTTKLFNTKVKTNESIESMMESMEIAYLKLTQTIKNEIVE